MEYENPNQWNDIGVHQLEKADEIEVTEFPNMLVVNFDGDTVKHVSNTPKNRLLFNRDKYSINGRSLYTILHGGRNQKVRISQEPYIAISATQYKDCYRLWCKNDVQSVLTPPDMAEEVVRGTMNVLDKGNCSRLENCYKKVRENQVDRDTLRLLLDYQILPTDRIQVIADGWLIDDKFIITWEAKAHLYTTDWDEGSYSPRTTEKREKPGEFLKIEPEERFEEEELNIGNEYTIHMSAKDKLFLFKVNKFLDWKDLLDDPTAAQVIERYLELDRANNRKD